MIKEKIFLWMLNKKLNKLRKEEKMDKIFKFLDGKKTYLALFLFFIEGGMAALGHPLPILKEIALALGTIGAGHKIIKGN